MSTRTQLDDYLAQARRRLRAVLWSRGAAALCLLLLIVTVLAAAILGSSGFSSAVVLVARVLLAAIARDLRPGDLARHSRADGCGGRGGT